MVYRAAVLGCGNIGSEFSSPNSGEVLNHAAAYSRAECTRLIAVADIDAAKANRCAARWQDAVGYHRVDQLLEKEHPDLVSICTPNETHYPIMRDILLHPRGVKGILCEKPLAVNLAQARELVRLAAEQGVVLAVNYTRRYAGNFQGLKGFLAVGGIGEVQAVQGLYTKGALHNGSHWFDLLRFLVGEVKWLEAQNPRGETGPDPGLDVTLGMAGGARATLRSLDHRHFTVFEMDLIGAGGRVAITDSGYRLQLFKPAASSRFAGYTELREEDHDFGGMGQPLLAAVNDLAASLASGRPPLCTGADALAALEISLASHQAAASGQRVVLGNGPGLPPAEKALQEKLGRIAPNFLRPHGALS